MFGLSSLQLFAKSNTPNEPAVDASPTFCCLARASRQRAICVASFFIGIATMQRGRVLDCCIRILTSCTAHAVGRRAAQPKRCQRLIVAKLCLAEWPP